MKIYHYNSTTKEYTGSSDANLDPLESKKQGKDIYLIPAYSTPEVPIQPNEGEVVIMDNGTWICVPIPTKPEDIPHVKTPEEIAKEADRLAKAQEIIDNLPAWNTVETTVNNITSLADAKAFIKKLARVVYILARTD